MPDASSTKRHNCVSAVAHSFGCFLAEASQLGFKCSHFFGVPQRLCFALLERFPPLQRQKNSSSEPDALEDDGNVACNTAMKLLNKAV
jgi:hypothetical protein